MTPRGPQASRKELGDLLAEAPRRDPLRLVQVWGLVAAFAGLQWWVVHAPAWWLAAPAAPLLALILVALFMLLHELMHYAIVGTRWLSTTSSLMPFESFCSTARGSLTLSTSFETGSRLSLVTPAIDCGGAGA